VNPIDLRLGRWQDALADVTTCDALICDPPYLSAKDSDTAWQRGTERGKRTGRGFSMPYDGASPDMLIDLCEWSRRVLGWCVFFNDFDGAILIRSTLLSMGAVVAEPIAWVKPKTMSPPRGSNILPEKGTEFVICARHKKMSTWHTHLPGSYSGPASVQPKDIGITGAKPISLMRAIVRDYSRPGDLVVDPFCGSGTTALACAMEGRRCVTSEMDRAHYEIARKRLTRGYQPSMV